MAMRRNGYALVGVEQTAQSKCITQFKFNRNTVLVLGQVLTKYAIAVSHYLTLMPKYTIGVPPIHSEAALMLQGIWYGMGHPLCGCKWCASQVLSGLCGDQEYA